MHTRLEEEESLFYIAESNKVLESEARLTRIPCPTDQFGSCNVFADFTASLFVLKLSSTRLW